MVVRKTKSKRKINRKTKTKNKKNKKIVLNGGATLPSIPKTPRPKPKPVEEGETPKHTTLKRSNSMSKLSTTKSEYSTLKIVSNSTIGNPYVSSGTLKRNPLVTEPTKQTDPNLIIRRVQNLLSTNNAMTKIDGQKYGVVAPTYTHNESKYYTSMANAKPVYAEIPKPLPNEGIYVTADPRYVQPKAEEGIYAELQ